MTTRIDEIQWFFNLEKISQAFNWPIHVAGLIAAKSSVNELIMRKAAADALLKAYSALAGAIGPTVMNVLLESDDAFPEVNYSQKPTPPSPGKVTLYVDQSGRRVLAACTKEWGMPPKLSVE